MAVQVEKLGRDSGFIPIRVLAGRYELISLVGEGGAGLVYRAQDRVTGQTVAVKSLRPGYATAMPRVRREIAALRLLRIPGVVTLLDEVEEGEEVHLVMDFVNGTHFPGDGIELDWDHVAPTVRALLETLGRVHAAGVIHRDLKPANVLVDQDGRVTLVDFGLSFGPALGRGVTVTGAVVGTPEYLAPEQIRGRGVDGRADIYALGVMLYQAFAGKLPFEAEDFADLIRRKLTGSSIPLSRATKAVPREVAHVIDRMLSVDPGERPQSAAEALRRLFGSGAPTTGETALPRLGSPVPLEQTLAAVRAHKSIDVFGPLGSGRSRLLQDTADAVEAEGRAALWAMRGRSPYASIAPLIGGLAGLESMSPDEAFGMLDSRLRDTLRRGDVLLIDEPSRIDPWSARAIERCRSEGSIVRVALHPTPGCVEVTGLTADDLRPLFAGPSRLLHLPEDAAEELWRRTGGQPGHVRSELSAWIRHGLAQWVDGAVVITRAALDRLQGGLPIGDWLDSGARGGSSRSRELDELLAWIALAWPHGDFDLLADVVARPRGMIEPEIEMLITDGMLRRLEDGRLLPLAVAESLQTWTEEQRQAAHRVLAAALPRGVPARLLHLAAAGEPAELIAETLLLGRELVRTGNLGEALPLLAHALDAARRENDATAHENLLRVHACAAISLGTQGAEPWSRRSTSSAVRPAGPMASGSSTSCSARFSRSSGETPTPR